MEGGVFHSPSLAMAVVFFLLINRQGKVRLTKWYTTYSQREKQKILRDVTSQILNRPRRMCNILEWRDVKLVFKRYASLFFVAGVTVDENELIALELIHHYVEVLDRYFGNVCELDLIFNFHKAFFILDEIVLAGELQETSKRSVLRATAAADAIMEEEEQKKKKR